jgi:hypothetical protein
VAKVSVVQLHPNVPHASRSEAEVAVTVPVHPELREKATSA